MQKHFRIPCKIERGGFSSERTFTIVGADGGKLTGLADVDHLCDVDDNSLGDDEPPEGVVIDGYVNCRLIRKVGTDRALVDLPGLEPIEILASDLSRSPCAVESPR